MKLIIFAIFAAFTIMAEGGPVALGVQAISAIAPVIPDLAQLFTSNKGKPEAEQLEYMEDVLVETMEHLKMDQEQQAVHNENSARLFMQEINSVKRMLKAKQPEVEAALLGLEKKVSMFEKEMKRMTDSYFKTTHNCVEMARVLGKYEVQSSNQMTGSNTASANATIIQTQNNYHQTIHTLHRWQRK